MTTRKAGWLGYGPASLWFFLGGGGGTIWFFLFFFVIIYVAGHARSIRQHVSVVASPIIRNLPRCACMRSVERHACPNFASSFPSGLCSRKTLSQPSERVEPGRFFHPESWIPSCPRDAS